MKQYKLHFVALFFSILMLSLLGCASTPGQSGTGEFIDDSVITTKVKSELIAVPDLKSLQINVETFKGVVQLSGFVDSVESVQKAAEVARSIEGVVSVKNDLIVR